jgi:hypothetical protein
MRTTGVTVTDLMQAQERRLRIARELDDDARSAQTEGARESFRRKPYYMTYSGKEEKDGR